MNNKVAKYKVSFCAVTFLFPFCLLTFSPPAQAALTGDLNGDSKVDVVDLGIFLGNWGMTTRPPSDLNQDGWVDVVDLGILLANWGKTETPPENYLTLINADTDTDIRRLSSSETIDLNSLSTANLNIRANFSQGGIGSVKFVLNGQEFRVEGTAPYTLAGDTDGDYFPWTPPAGALAINATAYSLSNAGGQVVASISINLNIIGLTLAAYNQSRDLISLHYDHAADPDDALAAAANRSVAGENGFIPLVVSGATGINGDTYVVESEAVMNAVYGAGGWLNAHSAWNTSVNTAANRWESVLNAGGDIWVAEAGQSDFTADVVRVLKSRNTALNTAVRIHLIQHGVWNEEQTTPADLTYVKTMTDYRKIDDGNASNNTADLAQSWSDWFVTTAEGNSKYGAGWQSAFAYYTPRRYSAVIDFSDTVELLYILGIPKTRIAGIIDFANEFLAEGSGTAMVFPGASWQTATPPSQGVNAVNLNSALNYFDSNAGGAGTDEMMVVRNGYVIWEGPSTANRHELFSATKTFTSTVMGVLAKAGKLSVTAPAVNYWPALDDATPAYSQVRLFDLATMTAGYQSVSGDCWSLHETGKFIEYYTCVQKFTIPGPYEYYPRTKWDYDDQNVHMLGYILTRVAGESLESVFKKNIADKIGMVNWDWSDYGLRDNMFFNNPAGTPNNESLTAMNDVQGGIWTDARNFARYCHLYLNRGNWNGLELLDASFVDAAISNQVSKETVAPLRDFELIGRYGYYWWTNGIRRDGTRAWPSAPPKTATPHGGSKNFCMVVPEWNMVIVRMSPRTGTSIPSHGDPVWEGFFSRLKPGVTL